MTRGAVPAEKGEQTEGRSLSAGALGGTKVEPLLLKGSYYFPASPCKGDLRTKEHTANQSSEPHGCRLLRWRCQASMQARLTVLVYLYPKIHRSRHFFKESFKNKNPVIVSITLLWSLNLFSTAKKTQYLKRRRENVHRSPSLPHPDSPLSPNPNKQNRAGTKCIS